MSDRKLVSKSVTFQSELFEIEEYKFKRRDGSTRIHHVVKRKPTVVIFPLTEKYELYLVSQYRYLLKKDVLEAPAGFIRKKESSVNAAQRELEEETGLLANQWEEFSRVEVGSSVVQSVAHLFLAKDFEQRTQKLEEDEKISVVKISLEKALEKVMNREINHSASMIGILWLNRWRNEKKI